MSKVSGTVKWFSNRKGFGFIAPTSDNSPTKEEIFVHHSALVMVEGAVSAHERVCAFQESLDFLGSLTASSLLFTLQYRTLVRKYTLFIEKTTENDGFR